MGKIAIYEYPEYTLSETIKVLEAIRDEKISRKDTLALKFGHKDSKSGAFLNRITAMIRYGLAVGKSSQDEIVLSDLAKVILHPKDDYERANALSMAAKNITLFAILYQKLGDKVPNSNFWVDLADITGSDRELAKKEADKVSKLYKDALQYLKPVEKAQESRFEQPTLPESVSEPIDRSEKKMISTTEEIKPSIEAPTVKPEGMVDINLGNVRIWIQKGDTKAIIKARKILDIYLEDTKEETPIAG
jgi:hypothetical protein